MRPSRERLQHLPGALARQHTEEALITLWRKIARTVYSPRVLRGLPPFATKIAKAFWDVDGSEAVRALQNGDPAFFVSFQLRLDQIDCASVALQRSLAERAPIIRSKWILDGFRQAAEEALVENGGTWPPSAPTSDAPPA